jgi:signal transduction histidine kinase
MQPLTIDSIDVPASAIKESIVAKFVSSRLSALAPGAVQASALRLVFQIVVVFLAYFVAGKLGQATTSIRSSNLGPVWPAYGIALAAFLALGYRVWPGIAASAFLIAFSSAVPTLAAAGQALGATLAAITGASLLRRVLDFDRSLSRLKDALWLVVVGAFGSAVISASIGVYSLYSTGVQAYSGLPKAWLIYWLGDSTGVLLVTPLVFTVPSLAIHLRSRTHITEFAALFTLLAAACFIVFGDLTLIPIQLHVLAFAVLPFVMWAAISFGIGGASLAVFTIAATATIATAFGLGPFAGNSSFTNAVLLDVLFAVLAVSGLTLGAVIAERERAKDDRETLVREQAANETRLRERAEESVSRLSRRLFHAQEQERARIARELHDDIGQRVALLAVGLSRLSRSAPNEIQQAETASLERQVVEIGTDIQALSHELHSAKLELLGIEAATRGFCEEFASQQQVTIAFVGRNVPRQLPPDTSLCLFRVLQEAVHNSAKHSGVAHVDVQLWTADGEVHLTVSDAGSGFDLQAARLDRGLGLVSMEERLKLVAGALSIETRPGQGTKLHARTPYRS